MELVHGVPITKYCDDNHLTPRERLELFVPVCQAIQHAHQKGIIHRDIKPSNVMVTLYDGKPVPKVIDFGVAKATEQKLTERTLFTQYGTMVGTLEYMSPEQAEMSALGVDTRSDIYSLGVLLYELLTGSTPLTHKRLKEAAYAEILRMIKEEEPPKPSTRLSDSGEALASISAQRHMEPAKLTKLVRGELDWIVMKTPGEGPQPPLRDGQRLRRRRAALPERRAGAGVPDYDASTYVAMVSPSRPARCRRLHGFYVCDIQRSSVHCDVQHYPIPDPQSQRERDIVRFRTNCGYRSPLPGGRRNGRRGVSRQAPRVMDVTDRVCRVQSRSMLVALLGDRDQP